MKILYLMYSSYHQSSLFSQEVENSLDNLNSLKVFYKSLNSEFKKNITFRMRANSMNTTKMNEDKFVLSLGKNINFDRGEEFFGNIKDRYDLIVVSYDSTAIFELLTYKKIPFMVLFTKAYFNNYIPKAKKDFLVLKKNQILFFNEKKMANKINKECGKIINKWKDKMNSISIKKFCRKYCSKSKFKFYKLKALIDKCNV